jgi:hypothetical protein
MNRIVKYIKENLAGAGTSGDGGMSAPFSATGQEIDSRRKKKPIPIGKTMGSYVDEDAPTNAAGTGNIAALGVGAQGEPGRSAKMMPTMRRGQKFMGIEPYVVSSKVFNQLKEAKKRGKHWRTYLEEDDAYHHIRMEAKKSKGPIIVEDERTGALMYVRYGKGGSLQEAWTNSVSRGASSWLSHAGSKLSDSEFDSSGSYAKKIGNYDKEHSVYRMKDYDNNTHYHLVHNATGTITHSVNGHMKSGVLDIHGAGSIPKNKLNKVKMQDFYHHLLRKGARHEASNKDTPNQHPVALKGTNHSPGAQGVWRALAKKPNATVHGWNKGKAVNLGKADDPEETHAPASDYRYSWATDRETPKSHKSSGGSKEEHDVGSMALVASVTPSKKKKMKAKLR